jgi:hypothetical protein
MNSAPFCSAIPRHRSGVEARGGVDRAWGQLAVDEDYNNFELRVAVEVS